MRIACVVGTYPQPSETFIAREVEGLRARGHRVDLFSLFPPACGTAAGVTYGWTTTAERLLRKALPRAAMRTLATRWHEAFRARDIQAVLAHFGSAPSTVAMQAAGDLPFFLSLHARDIYVEAEALEEKLARAVAAVTCTRANLGYLRGQYPGTAQRIHLVYHGLPRAWLAAPVPERPRACGEPLRILAAGRFVEKKGFIVLLTACALLRARGIPFSASIVGDGPLREGLVSDCRVLGLASQVDFPGWLPEGRLRAEYARADLFCCPSVVTPDGDRDGLPNVLVEAMSTGLPAVGSNISGIPEAIEHEETGLLVPPGNGAVLADALARCADPVLRARLGTAAAATVRERFSSDRGLDQLASLLTFTGQRISP
jgi:glycosyltransferase involved in cell wall biosynthesis